MFLSASNSPLQQLRIALGVLAVTGLVGCGEQQEPQDTDGEVRESEAKTSDSNGDTNDPSSGKDSAGNNSSGNDSSGSDSSGNSGGGQDAPLSMMQYSAGSRLEPVRLEADDGAKRFYGWYDSKLEVPCTFSVPSTAQLAQEDPSSMRCLPAFVTIRKANYFTNNSCDADQVVPMILAPECTDLSKIKYGQEPATACGEQPKIYEIKSAKRFSGSFLWHNMSTTRDCSILTDEEEAQLAEVELGPEVELTDFVAAKTVK